MKRFQHSFFIFITLLGASAQAQVTTTGQVNAGRIPIPAVPFVSFTPDARSAGLGDAGVAISPTDANGLFWNTSKMIFAKKEAGISMSYTPWLRNLIGDMYVGYVSGYKKIGKNQVIGASIDYFNLGEIEFTNDRGVSVGTFQSREFAASGSYARRLSNKLGLGLNLRYINSNLVGNQAINGVATRPGQTVAGDISMFRNGYSPDKKWFWNHGIALQNLGGRVSYGSGQQSYFIPTNLKIGTALNGKLNDKSTLMFTVDANKLMVPTPPERNGATIVRGKDPATLTTLGGIFGSFTDAPDGFAEELKEITLSFGTEYNWNKVLAVRLGYFYENPTKGGRSYITTGFGVKAKDFGFDMSYLFQQGTQQNPLNNTFRLSLSYFFDKKGKIEAAPEEEPDAN